MSSVQIAVNLTAALVAGSAFLAVFLYLPWRMRDAYRQMFIALARAVESREPYILGHSERTARYVVLMCRLCLMPPWIVKNLEYAALLHGIGKVGVPYGLLNNPDRMDGYQSSISATDRFVLRDYVRVGAEITEALPFLRQTANIIRYHHEYYDGSGYPFGRYGDRIPFLAQILCISSEYVAMTTPRIYRTGFQRTPEEAVRYLIANTGKRYNRLVVPLFLSAKTLDDWITSIKLTAQQKPLGQNEAAPRRAF